MRGALLLLLFCAAACHQPWRDDPPPTASSVSVRIPAYEHRILANGVQVYLQQDAYLPLVSVQLVLRVGEAAVAAQQAGLVHVLYEMLLDDPVLTRELDNRGASVQLGLRPDGAFIFANVGSADALPTLQLLAKALREPRLTEAAFTRVRARRLATVFAQTPSPVQRAADALLAAIYGPTHPIAVTGRKTLTPLSQLRLEDVTDAYKRFIGPKNVAVVMAGRVPVVVGFAWAQKYLGDWAAEAEEPKGTQQLVPESRKVVSLVPAAGLPGTLVLIGGRIDWKERGNEAAARAAARFLAAQISVQLRLRGYATPGTETEVELETYAFGAHYVLRTFVRPEFTRIALKEIQEQLAGKLAIHISAKDSGEAQWRQIVFHLQRYLDLHASSKLTEISSLVHAFRGLTEVALNAASLYVRQLPDVYYIQLLEGLNALTAGQIDRAVERYFAPAAARVVLAGDPALIESQLRGADLGTVQRLPPD